MTTPLFPDVDDMLNQYLRPELPGIDIQQAMPPDNLRIFPMALVRNVGGGRPHVRLLGGAMVAVDSFAESKRAARNTAESVVQVLGAAAENQTVVQDGEGRSGHIANYVVDSAPVEFRHTDSPAGLYRYTAMVSFLVRP